MQAQRKPLVAMGPRLGPRTESGSQFSAEIKLGSATVYFKGRPCVVARYRQTGTVEDPSRVLEVSYRDEKGVRVTHILTLDAVLTQQTTEAEKTFHWVNLRQLPVCAFSDQTPQGWTGAHMRALSRWEVTCEKCLGILQGECKTN